jgi:predicted DNA-binding transcriptional regulator AlpA
VLASRCKRLGHELKKEGAKKANAITEELVPARSRPRSHSPDGALMRMVEVEEMVGLSAATIYRHIKAGRFPKPLKMGFVSLWVRAEVETWILQQVAVRDA